MDAIYDKLVSAKTDMSNREHLANIKKTQKELDKGICPRCGGKLVERNGQYGRFLGCSNYPKCKFILNKK
jgi:ssDNA-binding Zn-finger/Zn-ribbon topoisomerase 1